MCYIWTLKVQIVPLQSEHWLKMWFDAKLHSFKRATLYNNMLLLEDAPNSYYPSPVEIKKEAYREWWYCRAMPGQFFTQGPCSHQKPDWSSLTINWLFRCLLSVNDLGGLNWCMFELWSHTIKKKKKKDFKSFGKSCSCCVRASGERQVGHWE